MNKFERWISFACLALAILCSRCIGGGPGPAYTIDQTDSKHAGYRRTTITSGGTVYVHDFEEDSLRLANFDPKQVVGHTSFGGGKICAVEGQDPAAYLSADMGSEMPAYEVYRGIGHPPFDWPHAAFRNCD